MLVSIACGGSGTRMAPVTRFINKHLIPVGNGDLMVDMPLRFLSWHGFKEVSVVTGSNHASQICEYIGDGERHGFERVEYTFQTKPAGIADIFNRLSHKDYNEGVLLILGDNYFSHPQSILEKVAGSKSAHCFEYDVGSLLKARSFGQVVCSESGAPASIVEKPKLPTHSKILTGLYYFPADVIDFVAKLSPSARGELEITDVLREYLKRDRLESHAVSGAWQDLGENESWIEFVSSRTLQADDSEMEWHA